MKKILIFFAAFITIIAACKTGKKNAKVDKDILFTVGGDAVTVGEFRRMFSKNNPKEEQPTKKQVEEYLDLYVKFKLKVHGAKDLGLDGQKSYIDEMKGYRHQLAEPYLTDRSVSDQLIEEAYQRSTQEVKASHILIKCSPEASPKDTLEAYNQLLKIRDKVIAGAEFDSMAKMHSQDPSAVRNGGDLGYFTVFNMIYEFENVAYTTPVGEVSMPFRTRFGYHIVQVNDKRQARGQVKVAHIFIKVDENGTSEDWSKAEEKVRAIKDKLNYDETFEDLAKTYSDDSYTKNAGGEIGWLKSIGARLPESFVDACFKLTTNGQISEPVKSDFGWHLVKRLDYKAPQTKEEQEYYLKNSISRDTRSSKGQEAMVAKIKKEKDFSENDEVFTQTLVLFDSTLLQGRWITPAGVDTSLLQADLFTLGEGESLRGYKVFDFLRFVRTSQSADPLASVETKVRALYSKYVKTSVLAYKEDFLEEDNEDFRYILKEYEEGILLYEFMNQEIWNKAIVDTTGKEAFFLGNQDNYMWKERTDATIYRCATKTIADSVYAMLNRGVEDSVVASTIGKINVIALQAEHGKFEAGTNQVVDTAVKEVGVQSLGVINGTYVVIHIHSIDPPTPKTMKEAQVKLITDYQDFLEEKTLKNLKEKYPVVINQDALDKMFKYKEE